MNRLTKKAVTMLELLVVLVIISILSGMAVGVYSNHVERARVSRARAEIRTLEVAVTQYQIDLGEFPPSSSGLTVAPANLDYLIPFEGSGYLTMALRTSLNGQISTPLSSRWNGPYVDWDYNRLGDETGQVVDTGSGAGVVTSLGLISFLDPWGRPYQYVRSSDYDNFGGTELPTGHVFAATESYYNPSTFQLMSLGPNGTSNGHPQVGLDSDDITNFIGSQF